MADLVAFNPIDANGLTALLMMSGADGIASGTEPRTGVLLGRTKPDGLAANSAGNVFYEEPVSGGWSTTAIEYIAHNISLSTIAEGKRVLLIPINGRYTAWEIC